MKGPSILLMAVTLATGAMTLRADLPLPTCVAPACLTPAACQIPDVREAAPERAAEPHSNRWDGLAGGLACSSPRPLVLDAPPQRRGPEARGFPAGPGSFSLVLTAFGSLGAWRLGRSAKKFHFSSFPDWYHTGGPSQLGHSHALDLDAAPAVCRLESAGLDPHPVRRPLRRMTDFHRQSQSLRDAVSPRAPPLSMP